MTKNEVIAELRRLGWHRKNWRWFKSTHPVGKRGVMLRDAASFELLESSENLYEHCARSSRPQPNRALTKPRLKM